jgi:hypothetical protein
MDKTDSEETTEGEEETSRSTVMNMDRLDDVFDIEIYLTKNARNIHNFCHPNALLTLELQEHLEPTTKELGKSVVDFEIGTITGSTRAFYKKLTKVCEGERDLYF